MILFCEIIRVFCTRSGPVESEDDDDDDDEDEDVNGANEDEADEETDDEDDSDDDEDEIDEDDEQMQLMKDDFNGEVRRLKMIQEYEQRCKVNNIWINE